MRIKYMLCWMLLAMVQTAQSQQPDGWSILLSSQKAYINATLASSVRSLYMAKAQLANIGRAKVRAQLKKNYPDFSVNGSWNIVERYAAADSIGGVIWLVDDPGVYYQYTFSSTQQLSLHQSALNEIQDTAMVAIISHFDHWEHSVFTKQGAALKMPKEKPFYFASRISPASQETIGFYYP